MSNKMKLIMERFNNFINERINENGYVVAQALKSIENEGGPAFSSKSQAESLLSKSEQEIKKSLEPYLYADADRQALASLSEEDLKAELQLIATGKRPQKPPVKKKVPNIPLDQPPKKK